jgi:hypothetical protein
MKGLSPFITSANQRVPLLVECGGVSPSSEGGPVEAVRARKLPCYISSYIQTASRRLAASAQIPPAPSNIPFPPTLHFSPSLASILTFLTSPKNFANSLGERGSCFVFCMSASRNVASVLDTGIPDDKAIGVGVGDWRR